MHSARSRRRSTSAASASAVPSRRPTTPSGAAGGGGARPGVHAELGEFAAALEASPELRGVLANPQLDAAAKASVLADMLGGAEELVGNFVLLVAEKGRAGR